MGRYLPRDLLLVPSLVSLTRLPLAVVFPFCVDAPLFAVVVLLVAGATDVFDGWYARSQNQVTPIGGVVDAVADKVFVLSVVITLLVAGRLTPVELVLLSARELGELPLVVYWVVSRKQRPRSSSELMANGMGKLATVMQFATVAFLTTGMRVRPLIYATAVAGVLAAVAYWIRELAAVKRDSVDAR